VEVGVDLVVVVVVLMLFRGRGVVVVVAVVIGVVVVALFWLGVLVAGLEVLREERNDMDITCADTWVVVLAFSEAFVSSSSTYGWRLPSQDPLVR
jgi:hypothetical protein